MANDKGDNEMIPEWMLCTDLLEFTLHLRKTSARRPSDVGCATSHCLKWGHVPPKEVGRIAQHVAEEAGRKEGKDGRIPRPINMKYTFAYIIIMKYTFLQL